MAVFREVVWLSKFALLLCGGGGSGSNWNLNDDTTRVTKSDKGSETRLVELRRLLKKQVL